jgi:hypothetical protein
MKSSTQFHPEREAKNIDQPITEYLALVKNMSRMLTVSSELVKTHIMTAFMPMDMSSEIV